MIAIKPPEERDDFQEDYIVCGSPPLKRKQVVVEWHNDTVGEIVEKRLKLGSEKSATKFKAHTHHVALLVPVLIGSTRRLEACGI